MPSLRFLFACVVLSSLTCGCGKAPNPSADRSRRVVHSGDGEKSAHLEPGQPGSRSKPSASQKSAKPEAATVVRVFYGTNRNRTESGDLNRYYGSERAGLQFGYCDVSIPAIHETGKLEMPSIWRAEFRENEKKHVMLIGITPTNGDEFLKELQSTIRRSDEKEAFVFVHGYNVTFKDAARRTAQIAFDLKFSGAPILFSWPAQGDLEDYTVDETTARWAEPEVTQFLEAVSLASGAKKIHIIAHSMGNRLVAGALERMVRNPSFGVIPEFNQVVLTAPDVDADTFRREIAPNIVQAADRVVIYASSNDRALGASRKVHGSARLGQAGAAISLFPDHPKIEVVDASNVDTSLFSLRHSYFASSETVLVDMARVFRGQKPGDRGLLSQRNGLFWTLNKLTSTAGAGTSELK